MRGKLTLNNRTIVVDDFQEISGTNSCIIEVSTPDLQGGQAVLDLDDGRRARITITQMEFHARIINGATQVEPVSALIDEWLT